MTVKEGEFNKKNFEVRFHFIKNEQQAWMRQSNRHFHPNCIFTFLFLFFL